MDQKQMNKLEMFNAVQSYLDANTSVWTGIPIIGQLKNDFDSQLLELQESAAKQEAAQVYVSGNKTLLKKVVSEKADIMNDVLEAYAALNNIEELEHKANKSYSDFYRLPNQEFITSVKETISLLTENLSQLADYGTTETQLDDLKASFDRFLAISGQPRQYRIASKTATSSLEEAFTAITDLLNNQLDKLMKSFKRTQSNFYSGYQASRIIVDN